jgi:hypothetical protein
MSQATQISPLPPEMKSQDFGFLRNEGMQLLQRIAGASWTNHNLHDPGITLLEAGCYALTEMGLRLGMDIPDLVSSDTSGRQQAFFTAAQILPSAPVTINDTGRLLTDHPLVHNARVYPSLTIPAGRHNVLVEFTSEDLNSNLFKTSVLPAAYVIELGFPFWDEPVAEPFRQEVTLGDLALEDGTDWNAIEDSDAWFARLKVPYGAADEEAILLVVMRIITPLQNPLTEIPLILQAVKTKLFNKTDSPDEIALVRQFNFRVRDAFNNMRIIRRYLRNYRNLCEDFVEFNAARLQEIAISATLEINAGVNPENLLADIFYEIDRFIAPDPVFEDLDTLRQRLSAEEIFEGPLLNSGFMSSDLLNTSQQPVVLYTSDILRIILQQRDGSGTDIVQQENTSSRNIAAVRNVSMANYLDNLPVTINARNCLHLVQSQRHILRLSLLKSRIICLRNGIEVSYDINRVINLFNYKKESTQPPAISGPADIPIAAGTVYPTGEYYPIQNDLPLTYGVGEAGLPSTASVSRKAQALQLNGYLFFFEQLTAGIASQLTNFNAFFSAEQTAQTLFSYPLHTLPQVAPLLDAPAEYITALQAATEQEDDFLNRRNRVLNHLLGILGEDMYDKAELNYRRAVRITPEDNTDATELLKIQSTERNIASRQLIREKAAFLNTIPALNRDRAQSFGNPAIRREDLLIIQSAGDGFRWTLSDPGGTPLFRSPLPLPDMAACRKQAAATCMLATAAGNYNAVLSGPQYRLVIRQAGTGAILEEIAETVATFASQPLAQAAIPGLVQSMLQIWVLHTLAPIERRLYLLLGLVLQERRQLAYHAPAERFQVFNDTPPDPQFHKSFRLWELPGFGGATLLESEKVYTDASDTAATAKAQSAIQTVINRGVLLEHYTIEQLSPANYQPVLMDAGSDNILARSPNTFNTPELASQEINRILFHIYRLYNLEGFYMIEHALLTPYKDTDTALAIPEVPDPYSFQLTFLFPSGYTSNVAVKGSAQAPTHATNNMDPEYRKYVTQQVRKACPAHILPRVIWVDHMEPGQPIAAADPCFENVESQYKAWQQAWFTDEMATTVIRPLREALVKTLNAIFARYS